MVTARMVRRVLVLLTLGWLACAGWLVTAPDAHADPLSDYTVLAATAVCSTLDDHPTVPGVTGVITGVMDDSGFTAYDSGEVVARAVIGWCPRHVPLLQRFVSVYAPDARGRIA